MDKFKYIEMLETLEANAINLRDADFSEPNYSYQDGVANGLRAAIHHATKLQVKK